ncbi:MAG: hypothetical protein Q9174_003056 [Haloplaca sp. 1 TL-2023]
MSKYVLVTAATGKQGRAFITTLLSSPQSSSFSIIALTRDTTSKSATALASKSPSIHLIQGDLDDPHSIFASALQITPKIHGVYSVQPAFTKGYTPANEEKQGKSLIDLALHHGVQHFVYSSVERGGGLNVTNVPHFISKHHIEEHLISATEEGKKMSYTIVRPVAFMEGLEPNFMGKIFATFVKVGLRPNRPLQYIAVSDIGFIAAQGFLQGEDPAYKNQAINLAGDELTFEEFNRVFEEKMGYPVPVTYEFVGRIMKWMLGEINIMFQWFDAVGYGADIEEVRKLHPGLLSFGQWVEKESGFQKR